MYHGKVRDCQVSESKLRWSVIYSLMELKTEIIVIFDQRPSIRVLVMDYVQTVPYLP